MFSLATAEGTARYAARFPNYDSHSFYRQAQGLRVSSIGMGTYLGPMDAETDANYTSPAIAGIHGGINFIDTSLNYRHQRSERDLGAAISQMIGHGDVRRDE